MLASPMILLSSWFWIFRPSFFASSLHTTTSPKYHCRFKNFDPLPPYNFDLFSQYFHTAFSEEIFTFRIKTAVLDNIVMGGRGGGGDFSKKLQLCTSVPTILARIVASEGSFRTLRSLCLSSSVMVLPFNVTTPRDSYAWSYRELATLLTLGESLVMPGTRTTDPRVCSQRLYQLSHPLTLN